MTTKIEFKWKDGHTQVVTYPEMLRGLRHKGERPITLKVYNTVHNVKVVEWINECHFALEKL